MHYGWLRAQRAAEAPRPQRQSVRPWRPRGLARTFRPRPGFAQVRNHACRRDQSCGLIRHARAPLPSGACLLHLGCSVGGPVGHSHGPSLRHRRPCQRHPGYHGRRSHRDRARQSRRGSGRPHARALPFRRHALRPRTPRQLCDCGIWNHTPKQPVPRLRPSGQNRDRNKVCLTSKDGTPGNPSSSGAGSNWSGALWQRRPCRQGPMHRAARNGPLALRLVLCQRQQGWPPSGHLMTSCGGSRRPATCSRSAPSASCLCVACPAGVGQREWYN